METMKLVCCSVGTALLLACLGCNESLAGPKKSGGEEWIPHRNPLGFVLSHPPKWVVETGDDARILVRSPDKSALVLIQPFLQRGQTPANLFIEAVPEQFSGVFPQARLTKAKQRRAKPDEVVGTLTYKGGRANLLCSIQDGSGMLYAIAAPAPQFEAKKPALVRILESFKFTQPTRAKRAGPADAGIAYTKWTDPHESAFSLDVPKDWKVSGGMVRVGPLDARGHLEAASPDGAIRITSGDASLPPFTEPNLVLESTGFREGTVYSPGGFQTMVMRYTPGLPFVKDYVQKRVAKRYSDLAITQAREREDVARTLQALYAPIYAPLGQVTVATGEVTFTCRSGDRSLRGYYFAVTSRLQGSQLGIWSVPLLYGYVASEDRAEVARAVLSRMVRTARPNPQWLAMQSNVARAAGRISAEVQAEVSRTISDTYWSRSRAQDEASRKWSNTTLGLTDVRDPDTGQSWKVASGHNYYWRRGDTVVGTDTSDRPDIDFTPLREW